MQAEYSSKDPVNGYTSSNMNVTTKHLAFRLSSSSFSSSSFTRLLVSRGFATSRPRFADHARIVEVGPRDGLQNEKSTIPLGTKLELIRRLAGTGVTHIEAGSFVPPKWVPQVGVPLDMYLRGSECGADMCKDGQYCGDLPEHP